MIGYLPFLAWFVLLLFSLLDIDRTPDGAARGLSPSGWFLVVVLIPIAGALAWLAGGRPRPAPGPTVAPRAGLAAPVEAEGPPSERIPAHDLDDDARLQAILDRIDREFDEAVHLSGSGPADPSRRG